MRFKVNFRVEIMHKMRNWVTIATVNKNRTIGMHGRANKCYGPLLRSATQSPGGGSSRPRELIPQLSTYTKQMFQRRIIHFLSHKEITNMCSTYII